MIETIQGLVDTEKWNLEEAERALDSLDKKWFKFGKTPLIRFLKIYIKNKKEFIEELEKEVKNDN